MARGERTCLMLISISDSDSISDSRLFRLGSKEGLAIEDVRAWH